MAVRPRYLVDRSALARFRAASVSAVLAPLILAGEVATCGIIELEVLYSARSYRDFIMTRTTRSDAFPLIPIVQADFDRAIQVMEELARRGLHRAVSLPDLLIGALAEREHVIVVHYDADYDHIAAVTDQPMRWVVPRGSIP